MSNENSKAFSVKRLILVTVALAIACYAGNFSTNINTDYFNKYLIGKMLGTSSASVYTLTPILFCAKLFVTFGALAFIGYSVSKISHLFASYGLYILFGPVLSLGLNLYHNEMLRKVFGWKNAAYELVYILFILLVMLVPYLLRRIVKLNNALIESILSGSIIMVVAEAQHIAVNVVSGLIYNGKVDTKWQLLQAKDILMLLPITLGIIIIFVLISTVVFKNEFAPAQAITVGGNNNSFQNNNTQYNTQIKLNSNSSNSAPLCSNCGSPLVPDSKFCIKCGAVAEVKKPMTQQEPAIAAGKHCTKCGKPLTTDAVFCVFCGSIAPKEEPAAEAPVVAAPVVEAPVMQTPAAVEEKLCMKCGKPLGKEAIFCIYCGTPVVKEEKLEPKVDTVEQERLCLGCGAVIEAEAKFCGRCGRTAVEEKSNDEVPEVRQEKLCVNCGKTLGQEAIFCIFCGTPVAKGESEMAALEIPAPEMSSIKERSEESTSNEIEEIIEEAPIEAPKEAVLEVPLEISQEPTIIVSEPQAEIIKVSEADNQEQVIQEVESENQEQTKQEADDKEIDKEEGQVEEKVVAEERVEAEESLPVEEVEHEPMTTQPEETVPGIEEIGPVIKETEQQIASAEVPQGKVCSNCNQPIKADSKFCGSCGAPVIEKKPEVVKPKFCTSCGNIVEKDSRFCRHCGAKTF